MALPDTLDVVCPLCGQTFSAKVGDTQAALTVDALGGRVVLLNVQIESSTHACSSAMPAAAKRTTAKRTTKK